MSIEERAEVIFHLMGSLDLEEDEVDDTLVRPVVERLQTVLEVEDLGE